MLVLTRRKEQCVTLGEGGDTIQIKVLEIRGNSVRLGIEAPEHVTIVRTEKLQSNQETLEEDQNACTES